MVEKRKMKLENYTETAERDNSIHLYACATKKGL